MSDRRYSEEEVRAIFSDAANVEETGATSLARRDGPTLAEIEEIALEVGLDREAVRAAAARLDTAPAAAPRQKLVGMPVGVGRVVQLPRAPTDREWEILVSEARQAFAARGHVSASGSLREWSNGNLHVLVEPTADGHQLRMRSYKSSAAPMNAAAAGAGGLAALIGAMLQWGNAAPEGWAIAALLAATAVACLMVNLIGLPRWADEREGQFEELGRTALDLMADTKDPTGSR